MIITSTTNLYSNVLNLTPAQAQNDADYVNVCGSGSNICGIGIQAYEDTEGSTGVPFSTPVLAYLYGTYSIDPSITLTDAEYVSGDGVVSGRPSEVSARGVDLGYAAARFCGDRVYGAAVGRQDAIFADCLAGTPPPGFRTSALVRGPMPPP